MLTRLRRRLRRSRAPLLILAGLACLILYYRVHPPSSSYAPPVSSSDSPLGASNSQMMNGSRKLEAKQQVPGFVSTILGLLWPGASTDSQHLLDATRASAVKEMTRFAWRGYVTLCAVKQGGNELAPATNSCSPASDSIVGENSLLTVIDSLDTLFLMDLTEEFYQGRDLLKQKFDPKKISGAVSVFETTIRLLGGLLGAFSLTEDPLFSELATQIGEGLSGAFADGSFPRAVQLFSDSALKQQFDPASFSPTNPAEVGSLYLEFAYLSEITGDKKFFDWVDRNQKSLLNVSNIDGVLPLDIYAASPWKLTKQDGTVFSVGGRGDSYYEYLVKRCLFDENVDANCVRVFTRTLDGIMKHLAVKTPTNNTCITNLEMEEKLYCVMEHLTCFAGGMFALAYLQNRSRTDWLDFAEDVTKTCYMSYLHSATKLGPEIFIFSAETNKFLPREDKYVLRPETVESLYYLYHITGKQVYRDWGWSIVLALNRSARLASGFSGLTVSSSDKPEYDNIQWSFFIAETLKYLYLLFSPSSSLSWEQWLFNTEAHIVPTRANPLRSKLSSRHQGVLQRLSRSLF